MTNNRDATRRRTGAVASEIKIRSAPAKNQT